MKYEEITDKIIKVFYKVYNTLGYGFLEKVYERAMIIEFSKMGLKYNNQYPVKVYYEEEIVGDYVAGFIVEEKIIVEIKAIKELSKQDENQLLNYITSTDKEVGLLLNYGKKPEIKRKVYDNEFKKYNIKSVFNPLDTTNFCYFENIVKIPKLLCLNALILMLSHGVNLCSEGVPSELIFEQRIRFKKFWRYKCR